MASLAVLNTKINAAIEAFEGADYDVALTKLTSAELILAVLPDSIFDGNDQIRFDRQGAMLLIKQVRQQIAARKAGDAGVFIVQKVQYQRATGDDE